MSTQAGSPGCRLWRITFPKLGRNTIPAVARDPGFVAKFEERLKDLIAEGFEIRKFDGVSRRPK
jgi:hypothetical protein